jgi:hypothetical protein
MRELFWKATIESDVNAVGCIFELVDSYEHSLVNLGDEHES